MSTLSKIKDAIVETAPKIASSLMGKFPGTGIGILKEIIFGDPNAAVSEDEIVERLQRGMSPQQIVLLQKQELDFELENRRIALQQKQEFNRSNAELEGTASELKQAGFLGRVILFFRGCQRPAWGFFVMLMDWQVFSGLWVLPEGSKQESAFFIINLLVLIFLFGERAFRNVAPLIERLLKP